MRSHFEPEELIENAHSLDELVNVLETLFDHGFAVDEEGQLYQIFQLVARVKGLRLESFLKNMRLPTSTLKAQT